MNQNQQLVWPTGHCRVAIGAGGFIPATKKREGDGATPTGSYVFRRVLYRADRVCRPQTDLLSRPIQKKDGWCDAPDDPAYNRPVCLPYPASHENLFRPDHLYDLLVVLGHNDTPPVPCLGSAIFLHLARPDFTPTRGCVAITEKEMRRLLQQVTDRSLLYILP